MDVTNPVVQLCIEGTRAEFARRLVDAAALYRRAWDLASDDYEACIAAHYIAHYLERFQPSPEDALWWNQEALRRAESVTDGRAQGFLPSLYLSLGRSYELTGEIEKAKRYYDLAAALGFAYGE